MKNLAKNTISELIPESKLINILNDYTGTEVYTTSSFLNLETNQQHKLDLLRYANTIDFTDIYIVTVTYETVFGNTNETFTTCDLVESLDSTTLNRAIHAYYSTNNHHPLPALANALGLQSDTLQDVYSLVQHMENAFRDSLNGNIEFLTPEDIDALHNYEVAKRMLLDFERYSHTYSGILDDNTLSSILVLDKDGLVDRVQDLDIQLSYLASPDDETALWYRVISSNVYHTIE